MYGLRLGMIESSQFQPASIYKMTLNPSTVFLDFKGDIPCCLRSSGALCSLFRAV